MRIKVAVFAKTPALSPIKTRLAAGIGEELALDFYRRSVKAVKQILQESGLEYCFAVGEQNGNESEFWTDSDCIWTGEGGLGERMSRVSLRLLEHYDGYLLMGTDSPQLQPAILKAAVERLHQKPGSCVIGPSRDGGFYLFGACRPIPQELWSRVHYSRNDTLAQLIQELKGISVPCEYVEMRTDCDTVEDLIQLEKEFSTLEKELLPAQEAILEFIKIINK